MFGVLEVIPTRRWGIWGRLLDKIKPIVPTATDMELCGVRFILLRASPDSRGQLDWPWIAEGLPPDTPVLAGPEWPLPDFLRPTKDAALGELYLLYGAIAVLEGCGLPLFRKAVGVLDRAGESQPLVEALVPYAGTIKVVTEAPAAYEGFCRQMLDRYGAPIFLSDSPESLQDCLVAVSPRSYRGLAPACPVLAGEPQAFDGRCQVVEGLRGEVPPELAAGLPKSVDPLAFLAAALEDGATLSFDPTPKTGYCAGRTLTLAEVTDYAQRRFIKRL